MRRGVVLIVALIASAVLFAALASTGSAGHPGSQTLTFVERNNQGNFEYIDHPPKAPRSSESVSPGDMLLGNTALYNATNTRREGRLSF
jgi:hypothetical protein